MHAPTARRSVGRCTALRAWSAVHHPSCEQHALLLLASQPRPMPPSVTPGVLFEAAAAGDATTVQQWLAASAALPRLPLQLDRSNPFLVAARHGQIEVLRALHAHHPDVRTGLGAARNDGVTPLLAACSHGHADAAQWIWQRLPEAGRAARTQTDRGALEMAVSSGSAPLVRWLLCYSHEAGAGGSLPVELVRRLLRHACTARPGRAGPGSIRCEPMAPRDDSAEVIRLLCAASDQSIDLATSQLGIGGGAGPTLFAECCGRGNAALARWLLRQPGVATVALASEESLLTLVAAQGHAEAVGVVLDLSELVHAPMRAFERPPCVGGDTARPSPYGSPLLLHSTDFDAAASATASLANGAIAKLAVVQSLCDDAARVALKLRRRALATCLRRAAELTPIALAVVGARQRLAWGLLLRHVTRDDSAPDSHAGARRGTCVDTAELLSQDLIEMCGERVSMPWASATVSVEMGLD